MNGSVLPESLDSIQKSDYFPSQRHRWNTNEEIAAILIAIDKHEEWLSKEVKIRPKSGSMMLYSRKRVRYRRDGYCWKKRKDGKTTREDHMKLKVQGTECIYGCYVHSAILPTFHRRCYWLLQNPDIVLVHYLNVPYSDDNKVISPALNYFADNKKEWTKDELISELKPMFFSENEPDLNNELEKSTVETIEAIVQQLMVKQRAKVKALEDASDGGINAKALTVVNAITNSAREAKQQQQNTKSNASHFKNKQSMVNKRDVATCIITTQSNNTNDNNSSKPITTQGTVQLLQLSGSGQTRLRTATNPTTTSSQSAPTSLIFNLSQFQSGSGLLILNSPTANTANSRPNESQQITTPLTLLYGRPANNNGESPAIPAVVCSSAKVIRANVSSKQQEVTTTSALDDTLNNINRLNTINLMNGNICHKICNNNNKFNNENENNKSCNNANDSDNSDENQSEDNKTSIDISANLRDSGSDSVNYNEESMIVNSNPSTPEHLKTSPELNVNILSSQQTNRSDVDMNCNLLNHSQPQHLALSHNHNYSYNHYYNISSNVNNNNLNHNQNNTNINQNNSLLNYNMDSNELNPMDFIDNDIPTPDETLFSLDTFDILGDIDNLDDLTNTNANSSHYRNVISVSNSNQNKSIKSESSSSTSVQDYRELAANITDYSPEWCYPEGGIKVLVAGPWYTSTFRYTILFDGVSVATQLVQNGLLRCYSPEHEPAFVTLQVACDGVIISNSVIFEYRDHPTLPIQKTEDYFSIDENIFKFSLLERFELLESRLSQCSSKRNITGMESTKQFTSFEDRLVMMCSEMANCSWLPFDESSLTSQSLRSGLSQTDMSLIHLSAALNYYKLIQCLLKWRQDNPSLVLELEVDAFSCDKNECTPLMWSCAKGHYESAILLYRWNRAAINLCNNTGDSPLHLARKKGFQKLVEEIERLENQHSIPSNIESDKYIDKSINGFRKSRKTSLDISAKMKNICSSTVKRGSACLHHGLSAFPKLVKCFSADSSHPNMSLNTVNDQLNVSSLFLSSCISDSEDELEMSTSSTAGLSSSHRDSIGSCDIIMDCNGSEPSRVLTLAEHIIAAMPDRIKAASIASLPDEDFDDYYEDNENSSEVESLIRSDINDCDNQNNHNHNQLNDNLCNFSFELSDNYSYRDANTSTNSSPASSSCLHSPSSFPLDSPSPPPTTAEFCEFFQASGKITKELGDLTLTDREQRELYEAAKVIQKAYRSYKGRKRQEEQTKCCDNDKEKAAAILIQSYYRRYKQYMYYKQMTKAAQVIQNQYRNYCEHKRFKKSSHQEVYSVVDANGQQLNNFICNYSDCDQMQCKNSREGTPFSGLKRTYSQRRRNQAARKIQQFMRQSKNNIWDFNIHNKAITERTCISCRKRESVSRSAFTKSSNNTIC